VQELMRALVVGQEQALDLQREGVLVLEQVLVLELALSLVLGWVEIQVCNLIYLKLRLLS